MPSRFCYSIHILLSDNQLIPLVVCYESIEYCPCGLCDTLGTSAFSTSQEQVRQSTLALRMHPSPNRVPKRTQLHKLRFSDTTSNDSLVQVRMSMSLAQSRLLYTVHVRAMLELLGRNGRLLHHGWVRLPPAARCLFLLLPDTTHHSLPLTVTYSVNHSTTTE